MPAGVAVPARVRARRAEQKFRRFESDNEGHGARVIVLSRAFLLHFATGQATNNCVSRYGPSRLLSFFFRSFAFSSERIDADRMGRDLAVRLIHRTGVHRAEPWFEPSGSIAFMQLFFSFPWK